MEFNSKFNLGQRVYFGIRQPDRPARILQAKVVQITAQEGVAKDIDFIYAIEYDSGRGVGTASYIEDGLFATEDEARSYYHIFD